MEGGFFALIFLSVAVHSKCECARKTNELLGLEVGWRGGGV